MKVKPILIFDFDGVIVDGILEYWTSSRDAFLELVKKEESSYDLPLVVPQSFRDLRPWVKYGWEMVLIAAELTRKSSPLSISSTCFSDNYQRN